MKRFALTAAFALGLTLTACNNEPEEVERSSDDSVAPTAPETVDGDEVVSEGPTDDATPYAGTTGGSGGGSPTGDAGSGSRSGAENAGGGAGSGAAGAGTSGTGTMTRGSASASDARPPKGSKLQKADPR